MLKSKLNGSYYITNSSPDLSHIQTLLNYGIAIVQFRVKNFNSKQNINFIKELQDLVNSHQALFIINDDLELAHKIQADGVHLGVEDFNEIKMQGESLKVLDAIKQIKQEREFIFGVSCYDDISKALFMQNNCADYLAFGSCYSTNTKEVKAILPADFFADKKLTQIYLPKVAIGGINLKNYSNFVGKVEMIAMISALNDISLDNPGNIKEFKKFIKDIYSLRK